MSGCATLICWRLSGCDPCGANTGFRYEMERLVMMFFPGERMSWHNEPPAEGDYVLAESFTADGCVFIRCRFAWRDSSLPGIGAHREAKADVGAVELALGVLLYRCSPPRPAFALHGYPHGCAPR
jgi:hypothetical protein